MAVLDRPVATEAITYGIYDADEHYYEPEDAISRHLERIGETAGDEESTDGPPFCWGPIV